MRFTGCWNCGKKLDEDKIPYFVKMVGNSGVEFHKMCSLKCAEEYVEFTKSTYIYKCEIMNNDEM